MQNRLLRHVFTVVHVLVLLQLVFYDTTRAQRASCRDLLVFEGGSVEYRAVLDRHDGMASVGYNFCLQNWRVIWVKKWLTLNFF